MQAILHPTPATPDEMYLAEVAEPAVGPDDLLIEVVATALNRADLLQRRGNYPPPEGASPLLGLECAGRVVGWGERVTGWQEGERVMALLSGGGYAERVAVHHGSAMRVPERLSWLEAAALPEVWLTAYSNLIEIGRLQAGELALIHAGASGVGTAAIQLARWRGATPFATASAGKLDALRALGVALAIDYRAERFDERLLEATEGRGVDVILDFIGAPYWEANLRALAPWGRLVLVGLMGGATVQADLRLFLSKKLTVSGSTLRNRSVEEKARLVAAFSRDLLPAFESGTVRPILDERPFPLAEAGAAHRRMERNENIGKIVLVVREEALDTS